MRKQEIFNVSIETLRLVDGGVDWRAIKLDDTPFRFYGIESLTMIRLVDRLEKRFSITLEESEAIAAYSFERLVDLIDRMRRATPTAGTAAPNLLATIEASARAAGERAEFRVRRHGADDVVLSHERFLRMSAWLGSRILAGKDGPARTVVIAANEPLPTLLAFFAALGIGARPLILPGPKPLGGMEAFRRQVARTVDGFGAGCVLALEEGMLPPDTAPPGVELLLLPVEATRYGAVDALPPPSERHGGGDDVAFFQRTSASTGDGKLVAVSHGNAWANLTALRSSLGMGPEERVFTWLPLYHDMGLVGGALFPFFHGYLAALMRPVDFIRAPSRWIRGLSELRATFTGAPNFGFDYARQALSDEDLEGVDLAALRRVGVAAEPIQFAALRGFTERLGPYGFRPDSFVPGFGLAESTLASTTAVGSEPRYLLVDTGGVAVGDEVRILGEGFLHRGSPPLERPTGVAVFSLGTALDGVEVQLRSDDGEAIENEAVLGEIALRGPSISVGYFDPASGGPVPFKDGLLLTGDLGFLHRGELFVLDRKKNVIIRRGQNFLAGLLEQRVAQILETQPAAVIILDEDIYDAESGVHVIVENSAAPAALLPEQRTALRGLDLPVDRVSFARRSVIPRTTSGKKRYHVCRQQLAARELALDGTIVLTGKG
jgi:acyl-CoA synthetase (AMP-forming)/AMP-acid ligase II/acyl carrier protein